MGNEKCITEADLQLAIEKERRSLDQKIFALKDFIRDGNHTVCERIDGLKKEFTGHAALINGNTVAIKSNTLKLDDLEKERRSSGVFTASLASSAKGAVLWMAIGGAFVGFLLKPSLLTGFITAVAGLMTAAAKYTAVVGGK